MKNLLILSTALEIIENNIYTLRTVDGLSKELFCSSSSLQKLFRYVFICSVSEYISKRKLTLASKELLSTDKSITEVAFLFGYESPEVFTRAFKRLWGTKPSDFRKNRRFFNIFPKLAVPLEYGGNIMDRRPVDITELYDKLKSLSETYIFSIDIVSFLNINNKYGYANGDLAIAEAFRRIEREISEDMILFRIGGDEFAVLTGLSDIDEAKRLAKAITDKNSEKILLNNEEVSVSLRIGIVKIPKDGLSYLKTLEMMSGSVDKARINNEFIAVY